MSKRLIEDLMNLAELLGVGTKNSDVCLRAIAKINSLEGELTDETAKRQRASWESNPDRMGGMFTPEEINRHNTW